MDRITLPPKNKLAALREKLAAEKSIDLKNLDYLLRRASEFRKLGDNAAFTAYMLQSEAVGQYAY